MPNFRTGTRSYRSSASFVDGRPNLTPARRYHIYGPIQGMEDINPRRELVWGMGVLGLVGILLLGMAVVL